MCDGRLASSFLSHFLRERGVKLESKNNIAVNIYIFFYFNVLNWRLTKILVFYKLTEYKDVLCRSLIIEINETIRKFRKFYKISRSYC